MRPFFWTVGIIWLCLSSACIAAQPTVDIFGIGGDAFIDTNRNGQIDSTDLPLANAKFPVIDLWGVSNSRLTATDGHILVSPPSEAYPLTLKMDPPSGYKVVGTNKVIVLSRADLLKDGLGAKFIFVAVPSPTPPLPERQKHVAPDQRAERSRHLAWSQSKHTHRKENVLRYWVKVGDAFPCPIHSSTQFWEPYANA